MPLYMDSDELYRQIQEYKSGESDGTELSLSIIKIFEGFYSRYSARYGYQFDVDEAKQEAVAHIFGKIHRLKLDPNRNIFSYMTTVISHLCSALNHKAMSLNPKMVAYAEFLRDTGGQEY